MKTSQTGIDLITHYEQYHDGNLTEIGLQPKMCPAGIWTVGLGHALRNIETGNWLKGKSDFQTMVNQYPFLQTITKIQADELLKLDLIYIEKKINSRITRELTQQQFDALVSYSYNIGWSNTMQHLLNTNATDAEIADWFENHYITANGVKLKGLVYRRKSEAYLFINGVLKFFN